MGPGPEREPLFFSEFLPALFERTLIFEEFDPESRLLWVFTGDRGGFTVEITSEEVKLYQRYYDSAGLNEIKGGRPPRHPEWKLPAKSATGKDAPRTVTVKVDHKLELSVAVNGRTALRQKCLLDVSRGQLQLVKGQGRVRGRMCRPGPESVTVRIDATKRYQTMRGFGGIATPTAYAQLSSEGKRRWWKLVSEYNLLIQREYPIGARLNEEMDNWDRLEEATPHYYGDNFPNGEISDFDYIRTLRKSGGKVWFEFWALPEPVRKDAEKYAKAMVRYCQVSQEQTGAAPDVVGIQNEITQSESMWHEMVSALREALDESGFESVRIHMSDAGTVSKGIKFIKAFKSSGQVWSAIDYATTHMYDYQGYFTDPDGFDGRLAEWKRLAGNKPFLSTELCINSSEYQRRSYRVALAMGQLYHKNLVLADAAAICYCWVLLDIEQPSYGWTRTLFVPDRANGFVPKPSSFQLRVFGAYSRRIREGMFRVGAETEADDLLVSAFSDKDGAGTVVALNRSTRPRRLRIIWKDIRFTEVERVDAYHQNEVLKGALNNEEGAREIVIEPGAIITLTNVDLGKAARDVLELIE